MSDHITEARIAELEAELAKVRKLCGEAADPLDEHYDGDGNCFSCHSACIPDPENYDDLDPAELDHSPDCLVSRLRAASTEPQEKSNG